MKDTQATHIFKHNMHGNLKMYLCGSLLNRTRSLNYCFNNWMAQAYMVVYSGNSYRINTKSVKPNSFRQFQTSHVFGLTRFQCYII